MKKIPEHIYQAAITRRANTAESLEETIDYFRRHFGGIEIPKTTLYNRCKKAFGTNTAQNGTFGAENGTDENGLFSDSYGATTQTTENVVIERVNAILNSSEQKQRRSTFRLSVPRTDLVFYFVIGTGCLGFYNLMGWWALLIAVPYALVSIECLENAKDKSLSSMAGEWQSAVIVMELIASVFNHSLFNAVFWAHIDSLPFNIVRQGNLVLVGYEVPFYAACFVSFILFCMAFFAVNVTIKKTQKANG